MPKVRNAQLTRLELEIMDVLWKIQSGTVQEVLDNLEKQPKLAYTTIQTMLIILHRKGRVKRTMEGKAHRYTPVLSQSKAAAQALADVVHRFFGGSPESLVMNLVKSRQLSTEKLAELTRLVERAQEETKRSS